MKNRPDMIETLVPNVNRQALCTALALCVVLATGCSSETTPDDQAAQQVTDSPSDSGVGSTPAILQPAPAVGSNSGAVNTQVACDATAAEVQSAMTKLINDFRASPQNCDAAAFPAAAALTWNSMLELAASAHSADMVQHNFFSHTGSDGSSSSDRIGAAGYNWRATGENIAGGQPNAEAAVTAWINSAGHCANMMNNNFEEFAVSCRKQSGTDLINYWTLVFGTSF